MTTVNTAALLSTIVNNIWEVALLTASQQGVMQPLVRNFNDGQPTMAGRAFAAYSGGTVGAVAEGADVTSQAFTPAVAGTLVPYIYQANYTLTDTRIASDPFGVTRDAGQDLGRLVGVAVDKALAGLFSSLTGGTVGSAGGTLTWANILRAHAYCAAAIAPGPYAVVLRPEQWYYLLSPTSGVPTLLQAQSLMDNFGRDFYVGSWGGMNFFSDANITSGTAAEGGMFSQDALALDVRRAFRIEPQRDASLAGGGNELNASMIFAYGTFRPTFGCGLIGTSA